MTEKKPSKKSTWEKLNIAAKQDTSKCPNEEKAASAEKEKPDQEKQLTHPSYETLEAPVSYTHLTLPTIYSV